MAGRWFMSPWKKSPILKFQPFVFFPTTCSVLVTTCLFRKKVRFGGPPTQFLCRRRIFSPHIVRFERQKRRTDFKFHSPKNGGCLKVDFHPMRGEKWWFSSSHWIELPKKKSSTKQPKILRTILKSQQLLATFGSWNSRKIYPPGN